MYHFNQFHIPERMMDGINHYVKDGIPPGGFLTAVISNDLRKAVDLADDENILNLPAFIQYFYNEAPALCFGSAEIMKAWIATFE